MNVEASKVRYDIVVEFVSGLRYYGVNDGA